MKTSLAPILAVATALGLFGSPAWAAGSSMPPSGSAKFAAYTVCRSLGKVDFGAVGSDSSAECAGIVKNRDDAKTLDNLAIRCLEGSIARKEGYSFTGSCVETDADGDSIYLTYQGPESGPLKLIGGSGKYKDISGQGTWAVTDAPGNSPSLFAFTLDFSVEWKSK